MKIPGPDHPITIKPSTDHVRVTFNGKVIADTKRALVLQEAAYKPVLYIPREDAQMALTSAPPTRRIAPTRATPRITRSRSATARRRMRSGATRRRSRR